MLIDSHNHVNYLTLDAEGLLAEMDTLGIDRAWLLTWYLPRGENDLGYFPVTSPTHRRRDGTHAAMPLADVVAACRKHPGRFVAGYCPHPATGDAPGLFEAAYQMHGVRVCGEWSYRMPLDDPRAINLFRKAGQLKCPVVLHIDVPELPDGQGGWRSVDRWYGGRIDCLERALEMCPETIFVGHAPGVWRYLSGDADSRPEMRPTGPVTPGGRLEQMLQQHANLWLDLSAGSGLTALQRDPAFARQFLIRWADRLMFGRDQHGDDLRQFLLTLDLPKSVQDRIFYENALHLVPMD